MRTIFFLPILCAMLLRVTGTEEFVQVGGAMQSTVIIPAEYFELGRAAIGSNNVRGYWTPDVDVIAKAQKALLPFLMDQVGKARERKQSTKPLKRLIRNLKNRRCQCVGIIIGDKRRLHLNFFPPAPKRGHDAHARWREHYLDVQDGGADFWRVDFDISTESFVNLIINGEA
jgi:hypothetical protein